MHLLGIQFTVCYLCAQMHRMTSDFMMYECIASFMNDSSLPVLCLEIKVICEQNYIYYAKENPKTVLAFLTVAQHISENIDDYYGLFESNCPKCHLFQSKKGNETKNRDNEKESKTKVRIQGVTLFMNYKINAKIQFKLNRNSFTAFQYILRDQINCKMSFIFVQSENIAMRMILN